MQTKAYISHLAMILFGISTSAGMMLIHVKVQSTPPMVLAFYTFVFFVLFFLAFSLHGLTKKHHHLKKAFPTIFNLNWTSLVCWSATTIALLYLPTSLFLLLYLSSMMIAGLFIGKKLNRFDIACMAIVITGCILAMTDQHADLRQWLMAVFAAIGGVTGAIYSRYSKTLVNEFSTFEILALRFLLLVLITGIIAFYSGGIKFESPSFYSTFILISLLTICLPLYLFQVGLKYISVYAALAYMPLAPCICLVTETLFMSNTSIHGLSLLAVFFVAATMLAICLKQSQAARA